MAGSVPEPAAPAASVPAAPAAPVEPAAPVAPVAGRPAKGDWRGRRPFWGGLLLTLGGGEVLFVMKMPLPLVLHIGMEGLAGLLVPAVMLVCGLLILFNPAQRLFYSVIGVLAALGTWVTSNFGGFLIGMLLGVVGACLTFGWVPDQPLRRGRQRREDRRAWRREAKAAAGV
ncbi:DUF6114 domain-containing protein [Streptomyces sp. NRRL WC-3742]|uniref:DUF6114 domain-containing protein n=1 Tax=Streptomyces sp. NRRL WC-3742 TaxID=1463934 RepID=UPI001F3CBE5D|nr:DUF6114 domain-containing protein [Streptomyces sp. NRRL WC-3742]